VENRGDIVVVGTVPGTACADALAARSRGSGSRTWGRGVHAHREL